jgi:hypothetical protein
MQHEKVKEGKFLLITEDKIELLHLNFKVRWSKGFGAVSFVNSGFKRVYGYKYHMVKHIFEKYTLDCSMKIILEITNKKKAMLTRLRLDF